MKRAIRTLAWVILFVLTLLGNLIAAAVLLGALAAWIVLHLRHRGVS